MVQNSPWVRYEVVVETPKLVFEIFQLGKALLIGSIMYLEVRDDVS